MQWIVYQCFKESTPQFKQDFYLRQVYSLDNAHGQCVRDVDFNPNKQYYLVTCGDDCKVKFWDTRNPNESLMILSDHSHW